MAGSSAQICLTEQEEAALREWTRKGSTEQRLVERARIILLSHAGLTVEKISERLHTRPARVSKWRQRFVKDRLNALSDAPRSGKPHKYTEKTEASTGIAGCSSAGRVCTVEWEPVGSGIGRCQCRSCLASSAPARHTTAATSELVHYHRSRVRTESRRRGGFIPEPAGECGGSVRGRKAAHPS